MDHLTESGTPSEYRESKSPFIFGLLFLTALIGGGAFWFLSEDQTQIAPNAAAETSAPIATAEVAKTKTKTAVNPSRKVFFAYDQADLSGETKAVLDQWVERLTEDSLLTLQIEGHCDERGSAGYNMRLGERRGDVVRDYLIAKGINEPRLKVVSFGKSRPTEAGRDEAAYAANRRVEFKIANVVSQN